MTREEAIRILSERYSSALFSERTALETLIPELKESEEEKARKWIYDYIHNCPNESFEFYGGVGKDAVLNYIEKQKYDRMKPIYDARESFESALEKAWNDYHNGYENVDKLEDDYVECAHAKGFREGYLFGIEKQKEASKAIEAVENIDKYLDEHLANAHDMKDSNPDKKYYRGWDDYPELAGILQDVYSEEEQKEPDGTWTEEDEATGKYAKEHPANLEEAAEKYANKEHPDESSVGQFGTGDYEPPIDREYPREIAKDAFKAGAEWQQKKQKPVEDWREKRKEECPFRRNLDNNLYGCKRYADVISECTGACSWVVDYPKIKEIQDRQEQKPESKVEPKFRVGDTLRKKGKSYTFTVDRIIDDCYLTERNSFFYIQDQDQWELVSIPIEGEFPYTDSADTLDGEIDNIWSKLSCNNWFTADKCGFYEVIHHFANWIEEHQPKEWSEDDEHRCKDAIYFLETAKKHYACTSEIELTIKWLKSLRPQSKDEIHKEKNEKPKHTEVWVEGRTIFEQDANTFVNTEGEFEAKLTGWVARDENREIWVYGNYPEKNSEKHIWTESSCMPLDQKSFPDLKWEDEPVEVEITIRKNEYV